MYNNNSSPTLINVTFINNTATKKGGGIYNAYSSPALTNCIFTNNTATEKGGAVYSDTMSTPTFDAYTENTFTPIDSINNPNGKNNGNFQDSNKVDDYGFHVRTSDKPVSNPDGSSWDKAFNDLQTAIEKAKETGKKNVYVAQGTYNPTSRPNGGDSSDNRTFHFSLRNRVHVKGGYSGEGNDNDPKTYKTVLSGYNDYHVFYHPEGTNLGSTAKLTGVTITNGNASSYETNSLGGGMYNYNNSVELNDSIFTKNMAKPGDGGGMYNYSSSPTLTNCKFTNNTATNYGGGMYNTDRSSPKLTDCTFNNNKAKQKGGAIYSDGMSDPKFNGDTKKSFTRSNDTDGNNNGNFKSIY